MSDFCVCKDPTSHDHTCIFSGYIPDNQMTPEERKAKRNMEHSKKLQLTNSYLKDKDFGEKE